MTVKKKSNINPEARKLVKSTVPDMQDIWNRLRRQETVALAQAITCVESLNARDRQYALWLLGQCPPRPDKSIRIGITGAPGSGKSTLINALTPKLKKTSTSHIAVLTIDPSSQLTGGSILGDQTRMENLISLQNIFMRSSPSKGYLGGVNPYTRETITLCEAAGYNCILVETVGVGQSEMEISEMVDIFILVINPGTGDELQGIKKGIVEMADLIIVNKADGNQYQLALESKRQFQHALSILRQDKKPDILLCSATEGFGVEDIASGIFSIEENLRNSKKWHSRRQQQKENWFNVSLQNQWLQMLLTNTESRKIIHSYLEDVRSDRLSPVAAAAKCISQIKMIKRDL